MKPSRKLDARIAEVVMGWTGVAEATYASGDRQWLGTPPITRAFREVPHYSTSIADAWLVLERLWRDSPSYFVRPDTKDGVEGYSVGEMDAWLEVQPDFVWGETAPHAICLAALHTFEAAPA